MLAGLDGTGSAITPHLTPLSAHGLCVQSLYIPPTNRLSWQELTAATVPLLRTAAAAAAPNPLILVAESFGACLALRAMHAAPDAAAKLVLMNSATSFNSALLGVPGLVADTGLLALFNTPLYNVAQVLLLATFFALTPPSLLTEQPSFFFVSFPSKCFYYQGV